MIRGIERCGKKERCMKNQNPWRNEVEERRYKHTILAKNRRA